MYNKKKRVSSLELVIFITLIHLINAIQQTVHTGISQQGEKTRPPWHSCFNPSLDASAWERQWKSLLLVKRQWMSLLPVASKCWVRTWEEPSSLMLLSSMWPPRQPAHCVFWWRIYTSASLKALTHPCCVENAAEGPKPAKSRGRSWSRSRGLWRCCWAHWYSSIFLWETHISQLIDDHLSCLQGANKMQHWENQGPHPFSFLKKPDGFCGCRVKEKLFHWYM